MRAYERPVVANLIMTRNCNIDCIFCGVEHMSSSRGPDADLATARAVIDELKRSGILRINYFGGEPLFYRGFAELAEYVRNEGFYTSIVTNGRLITKNNAAQLASLVQTWAVSIHGLATHHDRITRRKGAFDDTISKIALLREHTDQITINMTITDSNYRAIPETIEYLHETCSVDSFALNRCIGQPFDNLPSEFSPGDVSVSAESLVASLDLIDTLCQRNEALEVRYAIHFPYCLVADRRLLKYIGSCGVGTSYIGVDTLGNVQLCSYTTGRIGNLLETGLDNLWNSAEELVRFRSESWMPAACRVCEHKMTCMSGCKVSAGGPTFGPDSLLAVRGTRAHVSA